VLSGWPSLTKSTKLFTFVLKDENGNVVKRVESADGTVDFGEIDLTAVGVHSYTVSEEGADGEGWTLDKKAYPIDITVTDDGSGHLVGSVDRVPNLTNTYKPAPATVGTDDTPHGGKTVSGGPALKAGQFTFGLYDSNGNLVETGTNDGTGNILFPPGTFSNAGEYNFTFRETTPDGGGYTTDKTSYPYKVVVTDDGQGQLHAQVTQPSPTPTFVNTYTTAGSQSVVAHKTLQGWENGQTAPDFTFTLKDQSGAILQTIHSNGGTLDFGVLHFTSAGDYDYTINEEPPLPTGWTTTRTSYRVHIHAEDDGHGDLITTVTYPDRDTSPQFVNTYATNAVDVGGIISDNPSGENPTKTISGSSVPLKDEQFKFGLYDESGNLVANGYSDAFGRIRFPAFASSKLGESNYTMKELTPDGSGWTTDKTSYPVAVTITDDGKGTLSAVVAYPDGTPAFKNSYKAADASTVITGKVVGKGGTPGDGQFTFDVTDDSGKVVGQAHNDENGNIIFPPINLPEGDHHFHIVAPPNGDGWTFPVPSLPVDVTVTDNGDGTSTPHITYPNGDVFNPHYTPTPADVGHVISDNPSGQNPTKTATGGQPLGDQQFNFGLYDENGNLIAIGANDADGRITFPRFLSPKVGNARYTMKEVTPDAGGWTTDKTAYPVDVTVTDDGKGTLSAAVTYPGGTPAFKNTYHAADAPTDIEGKVVGQGKTPDDGQFEFDLTDDNGNVIGKARNDGNGNIVFPQTNLPAGDYHLHMVAPPDGNGWTFDVPSLPVDVHVTDNGDGTSTAAITYPNGNTFNPTYDPIPCDIADALNDDANAARKTVVNGDPLTDMQFAFGLYDENGILVGAGFNDASGKIIFEPMPTIEEGDQTYTIKELTTDGGGWTTDKNSYPVQVHVVDNDGQLGASITWPEGKPTFVNTYYTSQDATVQINARKTATGKALTNGQFIFELYDANGGILAIAENDDLGNITFPALKLPAGDYDFTMKETSPDGGGWTTDKKTVRVHVHVVDDGSGQSHAEITYPDGDPVFANVYQPKPVTVQIEACKRICGCCSLCAGWFHFALFDSTGKRVAMVSNDEDGNILIPLTFEAAGTYTYTLRELDDGTRYWKLDKRRYSVTITVTDNGQGELTATVAYGGGKIPTFVNVYVNLC
jgi:pilin isopeptide linkage protein